MSKTRTITLTLDYGHYVGRNPSGILCTHSDSYDGAPDSNHPIGSGDTEFDALKEWIEHADNLNDGYLDSYMDDPKDSASAKLAEIRTVIRVAKSMRSENSIDDAATRAIAFNHIVDILAGVTQEVAA